MSNNPKPPAFQWDDRDGVLTCDRNIEGLCMELLCKELGDGRWMVGESVTLEFARWFAQFFRGTLEIVETRWEPK